MTRQMPNLDHALAYAARGWYVFPVLAGGQYKEPLTRNGHKDASINAAQIRQWWAQWPDAGIGVAVKPSGLAVLDVDVGPGKEGAASLAALEGAVTLPDTPTARTGGGGLHAIYTLPEAMEAKRRIRFRPGLDMLADGYFVAPPSAHRSGSIYTWLKPPEATPIVELPAALVTIVGERQTRGGVATEDYAGGQSASKELLAHVRDYVRAHGPAVKGQGGDQHTFQLGTILFCDFDLTWDDGFAIACEWNAMFPENTWTKERLGEKMLNAIRYATGVRGAKRHNWQTLTTLTRPFDDTLVRAVSGDDLFARLLIEAHKELAERAQGMGVSAERIATPMFGTSVRDLLEREYPDTPWLVRGLTPAATVGIIGGEPKSCKTWVAYELAAAVASNTMAFGEYETGPAQDVFIYTSEDDPRSIRNRFRSLLGSREGIDVPAVAERIHVTAREPLDVTEPLQLARVIASARHMEQVDGRKPALIILDPFRDIHQADEVDSAAMASVFDSLRALRDMTGAAVLIVHHARKTSKKDGPQRGGQNLRGSSSIHGSLESLVYLGGIETDGQIEWTAQVQVEIKGAKGAGFFNLDMTLTDDDHGEAIGAVWRAHHDRVIDEVGDQRDQEKVRAAMLKERKPLSASKVKGLCGLPPARVKAILTEMVAAGELVEQKIEKRGRFPEHSKYALPPGLADRVDAERG